MALPVNTMTFEQFVEWATRPQNADQRYEFIDGEVVEVVSQSAASKLAARISGFLFIYLQSNNIGDLTGADGGYIVAGQGFIPDVAFIRRERQTHPPAAYYPVPPDLAVEVISNPQNQQEMRDLRKKVGRYVAVNTVVWVVDPDAQTVEVYGPGMIPQTLTTDDTLTGGDLLPGFSLPVRDVFHSGT
jgi:Uma2 family endonuclease